LFSSDSLGFAVMHTAAPFCSYYDLPCFTFFSSLLRFFFNRYLRYLARGRPFRGYATIARNRFAESTSKTAAATPVLLKFTEQSKRPKFID